MEASPKPRRRMWAPVDATHHSIRYGFNFLGRGVTAAPPDPHGELVCRADPDEVEVGEGPGQAEGQAPAHHDAQVREEND